jgi:hypothetical protein
MEIKTMRIFNYILFSAVIAGLLVFSGCSYGTRQIKLDYPTKTVDTPENPKYVFVLKFNDRRTEKAYVGTVKDILGNRTARLVPTSDVHDWFMTGLELELARAGYSVKVVDGISPRSRVPVISGDLLTVHTETVMNHVAEVSFLAKMKKRGEVLIDKRYTVKRKVSVDIGTPSSGFAKSLTVALEEAVNQLVADMDKQLGKK